jgi:hypothetical protein
MKKERKIREMQTEMIQLEMEEGLFKPRISQNSVKLLEKVRSRESSKERQQNKRYESSSKPTLDTLMTYQSS